MPPVVLRVTGGWRCRRLSLGGPLGGRGRCAPVPPALVEMRRLGHPTGAWVDLGDLGVQAQGNQDERQTRGNPATSLSFRGATPICSGRVPAACPSSSPRALEPATQSLRLQAGQLGSPVNGLRGTGQSPRPCDQRAPVGSRPGPVGQRAEPVAAQVAAVFWHARRLL